MISAVSCDLSDLSPPVESRSFTLPRGLGALRGIFFVDYEFDLMLPLGLVVREFERCSSAFALSSFN